jgi:hypothetical protein
VTSLVLSALPIVTVVASFAFSLAVLVVTHQPDVLKRRSSAPADVTPAAAAPAPEAKSDNTPTATESQEDTSDPMSRVLRDIERLASLREQGALTEKEFASQKAKLLVTPTSTRARRPQRTS